MEECCICLEDIKDTEKDIVTCIHCKNHFHSHCITSWSNKCPLCRKTLNTNENRTFTFNNMNNDYHNLDKILIHWDNTHKCSEKSHHLIIETLGEWSAEETRVSLSFKYSCMYVECPTCKVSTII
jgi:hypothetical protein